MDFRKCGGVETVASIVSGGSIVKAGKKDGTNILDQFMQWVLDGGEETHGGDVEVEVGVVPARDSVQGARYEALGVARLACGVPELSKSILEIVPDAYGGAKKALHFLPACASESMERVVEAARAELEVRRAERRSAGAEGAPASERRSTGGSGAWVAVVICAGWNCNEVENLQEAFVVKQLCETQTWSEFLWACSAHSSKKRAWAKTAQALDLAPPKLFQTNREDHPQAAANKAQFAQGLERHFVGDAECVEDIKSLGGSALLARYESFQQPAHRADLGRYIRLWKEGGSYLDIKMALLQPWSTTLQEIYAEGERCLEGQRVAQSSGQRVAPPTEVRDLSQVPHLLLSIGQNRKHIFQVNIWHASAKHPLLARAVGHALGTSQSHLKRYLLFCEFLWAELRRDLGKDPVQGWNFCPTLGPIYLFQEQMDGQGKAERDRRGRTCLGEEFPVDGHFMFTTGGTRYAATRAWGWKKGFLPVALGAIATQRAEAQSVAQPEPQPGTPAPEAPSAPPPEAPSSSAAQQRVAQLQETPSAATQPAANQVEVPPLETTITPEGLERIMAVATGQSWYEGLTRAEVEIFTVQGLREATRPEATEAVSSAVAQEIGQAMAVVEQTMDKVGVWAEQDVRDRVVAAAAVLPAAPPEPTLLDAALCATGEIADFFRRLTGILGPSIAGNRPMLATALKDAYVLPSVLQNVVRQRSAQGATWNDLTRSENVEWAVPYALAMCKGGSYEYVDRASLYSTILVRLVVDAVEETANSLDAAGRQAVLECVCVHFNEAARQQGQPSRLLIALGGARALKFDLDPTNIERQYGGAKKRVTKRQAESGVAVGRSNRVLQRLE
ncbi:unnamed protein product [Durusdinium trenchii]|uniref:CDAN1-interacting nuclease 1 n=1 Tax=Durusdinium trenchii TaxID=1381693 RepID=A0ABP0JF36_9DINO